MATRVVYDEPHRHCTFIVEREGERVSEREIESKLTKKI